MDDTILNSPNYFYNFYKVFTLLVIKTQSSQMRERQQKRERVYDFKELNQNLSFQKCVITKSFSNI